MKSYVGEDMLYYLYIAIGLFVALTATTVQSFVGNWFWPWAVALCTLLVFDLCVLVHIAICTFLSFFVNLNKPIHTQNRFFYEILAQTAVLFLKIMRVRIKVTGREYIPEDGKFLLVCNHISWLDPAIAIVLLRRYHIAFISRKENYSYPIANKYLYKAACLALDRENNREALKTINKAAEFLKDGVCAIGIYPEGWVTKTGELQEFRHGAFRIAKKGEAPVVVVHLSGAERILKKPLWRRCTVNFDIKGIIPKEFVAEHKTNEISDAAREIMLN